MSQKAINKNENQRLASIDIIRIVLTLIIVNLHTLNAIFMCDPTKPSTVVIGGSLACEAFYIISGFFLAKAGYKDNAPATWRYVFRKFHLYIYILILTVILSLIPFFIGWGIWKKPDPWPIIYIFSVTWYMWFMYIADLVLFPLIKKGKDKFSFSSILIGIACFVGLYFLNGNIDYYDPQAQPWDFILHGTLTPLLRSIGAMSFGVFIYACQNRITNKKINVILRIFFMLIAFAACGASFYFLYMKPHSVWDFMVVFLYIIFFFVVLTGIGIISPKFKLPNKVCSTIGQWSLFTYTAHYLFIGIMALVNKNTPELANQHWWWAVHIVLCNIMAVSLGFAVMALYKPIKKNILSKMTKLNSI